MSNDRKARREIDALLREHSLTIVGERHNKHRVVTVRNKNGVEAQLTIGASPSDYRAMKNFRQVCREISERTHDAPG